MFASLIVKDLVVNKELSVLNLMEKIESISRAGITKLVIAPFYYDEESNTSIDEVNKLVDDLNLYVKEKGLDIKLYSANIIRDNFDNIIDFVKNPIIAFIINRNIFANNKF